MRHRIVLLVALAVLVMSALPVVAVDAPEVDDQAVRDAEAAAERAAAGEATDESPTQVEAFDGTDGGEDAGGVDLEQRAEELAAEDEPDIHIVQFSSPAVPSYTGGVDGLETTAPEGERLDTDASEVQAYREHLEAERAEGVEAITAALEREVAPDRSYDLAVNGIAVELAPEEAAAVLGLPEVAYVDRQQIYELETDAGPEHMNADAIWDGDYAGAPDDGVRGEGAVVGVLDSGIWPENPSFSDDPDDYNTDYEYVWDDDYFGVCDDEDADFPCNDKLIGAWGMTDANDPYDSGNHGTHVASTAAGNVVDVELGPEGNEQQLEISGVAPHAHVISYRVCDDGCPLDAIIGGVDQGIEDQVDVLNYSIGGPDPSTGLWDAAENVAWLNANGAGIHIAQSAGNDGPGDATVNRSSDLPWVTSVGASEHDRAIENQLIDVTGLDEPVVGKGFTGGLESGTEVVYDEANAYCNDPVDEDIAEGAIVLCDRGGPAPIGRVESSENVAAAGGVGFVLMNTEPQADSVHGDEFAVPGVHVTFDDGETLKGLVDDGDVTAGVAGYEFADDHQFTDYHASFSSRGPNQAAQTLVPNITAPGLDIIAAVNPDEDGNPQWGVSSGTSMSSPHVAGAYGLLAAARADWSPAEAQSALQLTARDGTPKEDGSDGDPHSEGSGYAELSGAVDAGFVMDITQEEFEAADPDEGGDVRQLNFADLVNYDHAGSFTWERELTSTQETDVTYTVSFEGDDGLDVDVPDEITIDAEGTEQVVFTATTDEDVPIGETLFGRVTLTSDADVPDAHMPVVVTTAEPESELTVSPGHIGVDLEPGDSSEETITVGNVGNTGLNWQLTEEDAGPIWDQPITDTAGIVSDYFIGDTDAGTYAADDFIVGDGTEIESIFVPGFWAPTFPGSIAEAEALTWYVYPDQGGEPAGHPEDGEENHAWTFSAEPGDDGISIEEDDVTLDIEASDAGLVDLDGGHYWLVFFPDIIENPTSLNDRWNWYNGTSQLESAHLADPAGLFGGSDGWEPFPDRDLDWDGLAFTLSGEFDCTMPEDVEWLDVDPTSGDLGPGDSQAVDVTFDATGMDRGTYIETLCIGTDEAEAPTSPVTLTMEVLTYGSVEGQVTAADTEDPIEDAEVWVAGTDLSTTTDQDGGYLFDGVVPSGEQTVAATARGYGTEEQQVEVEEDQTATVDFELQTPPPMIGIFGDDEFGENDGDELAWFLDSQDLPHEPFELGDDVADFSVIIVNKAEYPEEEEFLEFIDDADQYGTGLVLLDSSSAQVSGIPLLHNHLDNPAVRETGNAIGAEEFSFEVTTEHPIVEGFDPGDEILFSIDPPTTSYAWFDEYTGDDVTIIADALADGDMLGTSIAAEERDSTRHALLSLHGASWPWGGPEAWEPEGEEVFLNALDWASGDVDLDPPELENLAVEPEEAEIDVDESVQLTATAHYDDGSEETVTDEAEWISEDDDIATVDDAGLVTGVAEGATDVTAEFEGESDTAQMFVEPELVLDAVVVTPDPATVEPGETVQLTAEAHYEDVDEPVDVTDEATWASEDTDIATVDDAGLVTGVAEGDTEVSAEFEGETGSAQVIVSEEPVDPPPEDPVALEVTPDESTIGVDGVVQLEATAIYEDDTAQPVTGEADWVSADDEVATVDDEGLVVGIAEGATEVTATFDDVSDSASVTVDAEVEPGPEGLERISAEPGRVEVAIAASQHRFDDGEAAAVVLARADEYPDALAGTTLAAEVDAPLLLTSSDDLLGNVADEIDRVLGDEGAVYLTGGTAALDENVEDAADSLGYDLARLGGQTRFETAGLIADELGERSQVLVTTGLDFPDALTAGAAAAAHDGVVLLSADEDPHEVVDDYLEEFQGDVTAVGGPATRAYPDAEPVMGETRDETAVAVAEAFFEEPTAFGVARRDDYPDALAGGAHIAAYEGPLLLSYTDDVPEETAEWLQATEATGGFVYGGTAAIDEDTFDELEDLAGFDDNDNDDDNDDDEDGNDDE